MKLNLIFLSSFSLTCAIVMGQNVKKEDQLSAAVNNLANSLLLYANALTNEKNQTLVSTSTQLKARTLQLCSRFNMNLGPSINTGRTFQCVGNKKTPISIQDILITGQNENYASHEMIKGNMNYRSLLPFMRDVSNRWYYLCEAFESETGVLCSLP